MRALPHAAAARRWDPRPHCRCRTAGFRSGIWPAHLVAYARREPATAGVFSSNGQAAEFLRPCKTQNIWSWAKNWLNAL